MNRTSNRQFHDLTTGPGEKNALPTAVLTGEGAAGAKAGLDLKQMAIPVHTPYQKNDAPIQPYVPPVAPNKAKPKNR
jgi:hypothetical protein